MRRPAQARKAGAEAVYRNAGSEWSSQYLRTLLQRMPPYLFETTPTIPSISCTQQFGQRQGIAELAVRDQNVEPPVLVATPSRQRMLFVPRHPKTEPLE